MAKRRNDEEDVKFDQDEGLVDDEDGNEDEDDGDDDDSDDDDGDDGEFELDDVLNRLGEAASEDPRTHRFGLFFVDDSGYGAFSWFAGREELEEVLEAAAEYFESFQFAWSGLKWSGELDELIEGDSNDEFIAQLRGEYRENENREATSDPIPRGELDDFIEFLRAYAD